MKAKLFAFLMTSVILTTFISPSPSFAATPKAAQTKMAVCETRQGNIQTRMQSLIDLSANMEKKFDSIAQKVQRYYTDKLVPSGKTLSNYDVLIGDIQTKKTAVDTALEATKTAANGFTCNSTNPRALYLTYRTNMQKTKTALHNYRIAIKNLIVAVRTLSAQESPAPNE